MTDKAAGWYGPSRRKKERNWQMKHSNLYYTCKKDGIYELCEKATGVRNQFGIDFFRYNTMIYDGKTGFRICAEDELPVFLEKHVASKEAYDELLKAEMQRAGLGLSPRYTQPDVRREPVPRNENRVLERQIGSKSKHYFTRTDTLENGVELFLKDADKALGLYSQLLYIRLNGWMVGWGSLGRKDEIVEELSAPNFDPLQVLLDQHEKEMADTQHWANPSLGDLFGCREAVEARNKPIREAWEAKRQRDMAEREAAELAREQEQEQAYRTAIAEAEQKLLSGEVVQEADINGSSLLLQLFRENNINVPLRTQGWIRSSLVSIQRKGDDNATYYYRRSDSSVIGEYIMKLIKVLEEKMGDTE